MYNEITWKESEREVQLFMKNNGYKILMTNFSHVGVELDIVSILSKSVQKKKMKQETKRRMIEDRPHRKVYKNSYKNALKELTDLLVITEVKGRANDKFGKGFEAITEQKIHNIVRGARFLQKDGKFKNCQIRFDVASVDNGEITYIENAF